MEGEVDIPYCLSESRWMRIKQYIDNICGVAIAHEDKEFEQYRSDRKMRGRGSEKEEPVFILLFSSPYGLAFFRNAMHREGTQIQDRKLYNLPPKTQELFQAVRWKNDLIILNTERISRALDWAWPASNIHRRVNKCRKLLEILHENEFINKPIERGKTIERKDWIFYVRKRKLISFPVNIN